MSCPVMKIMSNKLERNSFSGKENLPPGRVIGLEELAVSVKPKSAKADKAIPREPSQEGLRRDYTQVSK